MIFHGDIIHIPDNTWKLKSIGYGLKYSYCGYYRNRINQV